MFSPSCTQLPKKPRALAAWLCAASFHLDNMVDTVDVYDCCFIKYFTWQMCKPIFIRCNECAGFCIMHDPRLINFFYRASVCNAYRLQSAILFYQFRLSVCLALCSMPVPCQNEWTHRHTFLTLRHSFLSPTAVTKFHRELPQRQR